MYLEVFATTIVASASDVGESLDVDLTELDAFLAIVTRSLCHIWALGFRV